MFYKSLFTYAKVDEDQQQIYRLEATCIYASNTKERDRELSKIKMILDRRADLKSKVYQLFTQPNEENRINL